MSAWRSIVVILLLLSGTAAGQTVKTDDGRKYTLKFVRVTGFLDWHIAVYATDQSNPSAGARKIATCGYRIDDASLIVWDQDDTRFGVWRDDWFLFGYDLAAARQLSGAAAYELKPPPPMEKLSRAERAIRLMNQPDAGARGHDPYSMLQHAAERGHVDVAQSLLAAKADPNHDANYPVLNTAARAGQIEIIRLLLRHGARIDGGTGLTPLQVATLDKNHAVMSELIKNGADVNKGVPLISTAAEGDEKGMTLLLDAGADVQAKGSGGKTSLEVAVWRKQDRAAALLRSRGAK
jgi:ankyrin repeat protein